MKRKKKVLAYSGRLIAEALVKKGIASKRKAERIAMDLMVATNRGDKTAIAYVKSLLK